MQIPAVVGKYELLEFLGGGMSHVYRARDTIIERPVVVKLLTPEACQDQEAKARFLQEAKLAGNIQHENIVSVFDFGEHDGRPYIVMEYLRGEDLRNAIRGGRTGSMLDRMKIALQIAEALDYVNSRGIVHRDIKPENVNIDPNGKVKLMDFGIAKTADLSLTKTGMTMGTPYYMAPEQVAGRPATAQVDIYAYGMVLFELLTGSRAINGDNIEQVLFQILNQPLDPTPMVNAGATPELRALVLRCVEKKPEDRPPNFRVISEELRALMAGVSIERTEPLETHSAKTQPVRTVSPVEAVQSSAPMAAPPPAAIVEMPREAQQKSSSPMGLWVTIAVVVIAGVGGAVWWSMQGNKAADPSDKRTTASTKTQAQAAPVIQGMIYVPAGSFLSGAANTPTEMHAFYIDETEVSNADFAAYCQSAGCKAPTGAPDLPVVGITVTQAREFAASKGKRLPDGLEWERAARGTNGWKYPWGDTEDKSLANVAGSATMPVKSFKGYPAYQMAGNVWEMVEGNVTPSKGAIASFAKLLSPPPTAEEKWINVRGGSFKMPLGYAVAYEFLSIPERFSKEDIGFRCAKSAP
jgi:serine/threonine-protein kinase